MAKWMNDYRVGERVEVEAIFADGRRWVEGRIVRKTKTGIPIVDANGLGWCMEVRRKDEIRKLSPRPPSS